MARDPCLLRFKKKLLQQDLSQTTIYGYLDDLNYFLRWLKNLYGHTVELKKINSADVRAYRQELITIKRQKATSVNRRIQSLKRFFYWAVQTKLIRKNPATEVRFVRLKAATQPLALTKAEVHALLRVAGQSSHGLAKRNYALLQLILQAGLRIGEVVKLQYRDITINKRSGSVKISYAKGFKEREVPLNATARRALSNYLETRDKLKPKSPLFLTKQSSCPVIRTLQLAIFNMARRAKINRIKVSAHFKTYLC